MSTYFKESVAKRLKSVISNQIIQNNLILITCIRMHLLDNGLEFIDEQMIIRMASLVSQVEVHENRYVCNMLI